MTLTPDTIDIFFDELIAELQADGVFRTYDEPVGEAKDEPHPEHTLTHTHTPEKNRRGLSAHIGDMPYQGSVTTDVFQRYENGKPNVIQPTQRELSFKSRTVQDALKHYVPEERFAKYLRYFMEYLPGVALHKAFDNMSQALYYGHHSSKVSYTHEEVQTYLQAGNMDERLGLLSAPLENVSKSNRYPGIQIAVRSPEFLSNSAAKRQLDSHPEMLLALVLFQAAHIAYRQDLMAAIERAYTPDAADSVLNADEHENARSVVESTLEEMSTFLIFHTLAPLIAHEHTNITASGAEGDADTMRQAITQGWQSFFEAHAMKNDLISNAMIGSEEFEEQRLSMVCPAKPHFRHIQKAGMIEEIFDHIITHTEDLQPLVDRTQRMATNALQGRRSASPLSNDSLVSNDIAARAEALGLDNQGHPFLAENNTPDYFTPQYAPALADILQELLSSQTTHAEPDKPSPLKQLVTYASLIASGEKITHQSGKNIDIYPWLVTKIPTADLHWSNVAKTINEALEHCPEHTDAIRAAMPEHARWRIINPREQAQEANSPSQCPFHHILAQGQPASHGEREAKKAATKAQEPRSL